MSATLAPPPPAPRSTTRRTRPRRCGRRSGRDRRAGPARRRRARDRVRRARRVGRRCTGCRCSSRPSPAAAGRCWSSGCSRSPRCSAPAGSRAAGATLAAVAAIVPLDRADAAGRPRRRRAAAARRLERAGRRHLARHLRPARRARALPRPRRLGAHRDPARRLARSCCSPRCSRSGRGAAKLGFPVAGAAGADRALRRAGRRARLHARVPARRDVHAADGRVPAPGEAAPAGLGRRPARWPSSRRWSRSSPRRSSTATRRGSTTRRGRRRPRRRSRPRSRWNHSYGALNWPRDGRELLRVRASTPAYWKAENLDDFDGTAWRRSARAVRRSTSCRADDPARVKRWTQTIKVSIRNLRTDQFITAGYASDIDIPRLTTIPTLDGLLPPAAHAAPRRRVHGDGLHAAARPRPSAGARASTTTPAWPTYTTIDTPTPPGARRRRVGMTFPFFGAEDGRDPDRPAPRIGDRPRTCSRAPGMSRIYALSQQLARGRADARRVRAARARLLRRRRVHLLRGAAEGVLDPRRLPVRHQAGLLPAVLRRDGAAAADGAASPRASRPASPPARPTSRPASTSCATSTRTPGSRSTTRTGAG